MRKTRDRTPPGWLACLLLVVTAVVVFGQTLFFEFTNYDDPEYVVDNPTVRGGLTLDGLRWAFTTTYQANWHPLTWLSLMLDAEIGRLRPGVFHLTNLLLHVANTLLLFHVLDRMTGLRFRSAFVAALFAVHPLHVESVAWIAERKDVLSTLFGFLTLLGYLRYVERKSPARYGWMTAAFLLGLLAKPMLVSIPVVLLLLDFWPLGRLRPGDSGTAPGDGRLGSLLREKVPLFLLALVSCCVTLYAQRKGGALGTLDFYPFPARVMNALVAYATYLQETFWPSGLASFYPHPGAALPAGKVAAAALVLAAVSALAFHGARSRRYLLVGWLWYLVTLLPVIGLVQVGMQSRADRYTYLPLVGIFLMIAWGIPDLVAESAGGARRRAALGSAAAASLVTMMALAFVQAGYWRDSVTLHERTLRVTGDNAIAENNLGSAYYRRNRPGDLERCVVHYSEAVRIKPTYAVALNNLAGVLMRLGRTEEAIARWQDAVRVKPEFSGARCNLAGALVRQGRIEEAIEQCHQALRFDPDSAGAHYNLGLALLKQGNVADAGAHFSAAVRAEPDYADSRLNLGVVLAKQGRLDEALLQFTEVLRLEPGNELARRNLDLARRRKGSPSTPTAETGNPP